MGSDNAIVAVGATGMLAPAIRTLASAGRVVVVARRAERFAADSGLAAIIGVNANWDDPAQLVERLEQNLNENEVIEVASAILWVHGPDRTPVLQGLDGLLDRQARFIVIFGTSAINSEDETTIEALRAQGRPITKVHLGRIVSKTSWRWLSDDEISSGVLAAMAAELDEFYVGERT